MLLTLKIEIEHHFHKKKNVVLGKDLGIDHRLVAMVTSQVTSVSNPYCLCFSL